jgi:hypothetical protein
VRWRGGADAPRSLLSLLCGSLRYINPPPPPPFPSSGSWEEGLDGMCVGERRKLIIPSGKGYGASGSPPKIHGGATLVFDVELLEIK